MTEDNIELGVCNEQGFRRLTPAEVKDYLASIISQYKDYFLKYYSQLQICLLSDLVSEVFCGENYQCVRMLVKVGLPTGHHLHFFFHKKKVKSLILKRILTGFACCLYRSDLTAATEIHLFLLCLLGFFLFNSHCVKNIKRISLRSCSQV